MKKTVLSILALFVLSLLPFSVCACKQTDRTFEEISVRYADLAKDADISQTKGNGDGFAVIDFGKTVTFNRLVLKEKENGISSFSLSLPDSPSPFYGNDFIGGYRYCSFPAVTTDKIFLSLSSQSSWHLSEVEAYYIPATDAPFSVTSYIAAKNAFSLSGYGNVPTDVFDIIYSAYLKKDGEIFLPDYYIDNQRIDGETVLSQSIANIRVAYPTARILATILGDRDFENDGLTLQQRYSSAFSNKERLTASLLSIIERFGLDGISFDYEYPSTSRDYSLFADFCSFFRQSLPQDKLLSAAVSAWCIDSKRWNRESLSCFDRIVLMAYDSPDDKGCHSTFYTAYSQLKHLKNQEIPFGKILLGIPLYSKPLDGTSYYQTYADYADGLPLYSNTSYADCGGELKPCYFNGRQLVSDKTALARDSGLCGIAAWHFSLDSSDPALSLLATAYRTAFPRRD